MSFIRNLYFTVLLLGLTACGVFVDDGHVVRAAEDQGFSDVQIISSGIFFVHWRGCGKDDDAVYSLSAVNAKGQRVQLIACAGWLFKGITVRSP